MADFGGDLELEDFRAEAQAWLAANFPNSLSGKGALAMSERQGQSADLAAWRKAIGEKGWATPTWPTQYGGGGLSPAQARVLGQEMAKAGAFNPLLFGMGITMIGPTILDYGTEAQKAKHIPPIVRGEVQWCVGYSEPNAGSDLASLQTKAVDAGDHWTINGQKTWTSGAQYSDWCGLLTRTDFSAKKHVTGHTWSDFIHLPKVRSDDHLLVELHQLGLADVEAGVFCRLRGAGTHAVTPESVAKVYFVVRRSLTSEPAPCTG